LRAGPRSVERGRAGPSLQRRALLLAWALLLTSPAALGASAGDEPQKDAANELRLGARDENAGAFAPALEHYRACLAIAPASRPAHNARNRIAWIEQRSEGSFLPLAALARARATPGLFADPAALGRVAVETESFPAGLVRSELRLRVAQGWLKLGSHQTEALLELRRVVADPSAGAADRMLAERALVETLLAAGQLDSARDEVEAHPFDGKAAAEVERMVRRRWLERAVMVGIAFALVGGIVVARIRRRAPLRSGEDLGVAGGDAVA
jgi:hypothetical protein